MRAVRGINDTCGVRSGNVSNANVKVVKQSLLKISSMEVTNFVRLGF